MADSVGLVSPKKKGWKSDYFWEVLIRLELKWGRGLAKILWNISVFYLIAPEVHGDVFIGIIPEW
jgi:hypothetical protein